MVPEQRTKAIKLLKNICKRLNFISIDKSVDDNIRESANCALGDMVTVLCIIEEDV